MERIEKLLMTVGKIFPNCEITLQFLSDGNVKIFDCAHNCKFYSRSPLGESIATLAKEQLSIVRGLEAEERNSLTKFKEIETALVDALGGGIEQFDDSPQLEKQTQCEGGG
jgi:hypothetical protein